MVTPFGSHPTRSWAVKSWMIWRPPPDPKQAGGGGGGGGTLESVNDSPPNPQFPKLVPLCRKLQVAGPPRPPSGMSHAVDPELALSLVLLMETQYTWPAVMAPELTNARTEVKALL